MTRLETFLAVIIGSCTFLLAAASISSWATTRHRIRHRCRTPGVVIDTQFSKGITGPPSYTFWQARHAIVATPTVTATIIRSRSVLTAHSVPRSLSSTAPATPPVRK